MAGSRNTGRLVAVSVTEASVVGVRVDRYGNRHGHVSHPVTWAPLESDPDALAGLVWAVLREMCSTARIAPTDVLALCVAVSTERAHVAEHLRNSLAALLSCPVTVRVDSYLTALAEATSGRRTGRPDFLMVSDDALRTVTVVQDGRPMERAHGLGGTLMPNLFRTAAPASPPRKPWAAAALTIAPPLAAAYLLTGSRTIVLSRAFVNPDWRHLVSHLESRIRDVAPAARPDIHVSDVAGDAVLLGATVLALELARAAAGAPSEQSPTSVTTPQVDREKQCDDV